MNINSTIVTAVHPKRRTISFANGTAASRELVEPQLMGGVNDMAQALGEVGAIWMDVEMAVVAAVEIAVDGFTANVTNPMRTRRN